MWHENQAKHIYCYWNMKNIDSNTFKSNIHLSRLYDTSLFSFSADEYTNVFENEVWRLLDEAASNWTVVKCPELNDCCWMSDKARAAKQNCLRIECRYFQMCIDVDRWAYRAAQGAAKQAVPDSRTAHLKTRLSDVATNPKQTWNVVKDLLHVNKKEVNHGCNTSELVNTINDF